MYKYRINACWENKTLNLKNARSMRVVYVNYSQSSEELAHFC